MLEFEGCISSLWILIPCETIQLKPVVFHVLPALVDFSTPMLYVAPPSPSPVAMYIMFGLDGSIKILLTPKTCRLSVAVVQFCPLLVDFHNPPDGAPANKVVFIVG